MSTSGNTADEYDIIDHDETALSPDIVAQIREWLQPTDYLADSGEFRRHLLSRAPGTGLWICQTDEYRKWHDSPHHGSLWIKGIPGAGKSVTAASIIQHLRTTEECPVLFFFFRNIVAANFSPRALIRDWLAQLLPYSPKLQFALQQRLGTSLADTSDADLIQFFMDGVSCVPKLYCVGDALDEMTTESRPFLEQLNALATFRPRSLKLLISSRPKQHLQSALRDSSIVHISLQQRLVDADIAAYLDHRFEQAAKSEAHREMKQRIVDMVSNRSAGLFLYAKLTMDQVEASMLSETVHVNRLEESLPVGLEQIYNNILAKQRQQHDISTDVQVLVLQAVTHASRPLRLYELASLVQCLFPQLTTPRGFKTLVATSCGPLVEILEDETLQVIHHSFTEFLRGDTRNKPAGDFGSEFPIIDTAEAHKQMAINCLSYLQSGAMLLGAERSGEVALIPSITYKTPRHRADPYACVVKEKDSFDYRDAHLLHPFLKYAVENWSYHTTFYDVKDEELTAAVTNFLNPDSLPFRRWLVLQWGTTSKSEDSAEGIPTALHIAAFSGLSELASELISRGALVSALDAQERTPLHWAAANGHAKVASLLVHHGGDPDAADGCGMKPIHLAAQKNHASVVTVLLEAGVKPDTPNTNTGRPFIGRRWGADVEECAILHASQGGHTETVKAMVPFCSSMALEKLLCSCCRFGRTDSVLDILENSQVSVDATYSGSTALDWACRSAKVKCVEALINRGASVRATTAWKPHWPSPSKSNRKRFTTPLHELVQGWHHNNDSARCAVLQLLIGAGVDLEQPNSRGDTPLLVAAGGPAAGIGWPKPPNVSAMRALLQAGADVQKKLVNGDTALHAIFRDDCDFEAMRLLVECGSDPNQKGFRGQTVLHAAMNNSSNETTQGLEKVVKYLLEHGADPNIPDDYGRSAVQRSIREGAEVFRMLLDKCKDDSLKKDIWFDSPFSIDGQFERILDVFLASGIDVDTRDDLGRTLYMNCVDYDEFLRPLRNAGANVDALDNDGNNVLHILCIGGCEVGQLKSFIADGVDPLARNNNGDTLLHHIATKGRNPDAARWIASLGVPINAVNKQGLTALHKSQHLPVFNPELELFAHAINDSNELDFEIRDESGLTALHMAVMRSGPQLAALVAAGADLEALTGDGQNVLHLACRARQPSIAGQILDESAAIDVNLQDVFGRTPLHYACCSGQEETVAILLSRGADVLVVDKHDRTPLHACAEFPAEQSIWDAGNLSNSWARGPAADSLRPASETRQFFAGDILAQTKQGIRQTTFPGLAAIVRMLLEAKADPGAMDERDLSPLDVALQLSCAEVAVALAADDELFSRGTKNLDVSSSTQYRSNQVRDYMKVQIMLMRPRSALSVLGQSQSSLDRVRDDVCLYLDFLTPEDLTKVMDDEFEHGPTEGSFNKILEPLLKPGRSHFLECATDLILRYSTHASLKEMLETQRQKLGKQDPLPDMMTYDTAISQACRSRKPNMQTVRILVERLHVDVNEASATFGSAGMAHGDTALHVLARADDWWHLEAMRYLVSKGAAVNARNEQGQTPLHVAAQGRYPVKLRLCNDELLGYWRLAAVRILLANGADPNILDDSGLSPLHRAADAPQIMQELLEKGADVTIGSESPLFYAIDHQNTAALELLLQVGLSVDTIFDARQSRGLEMTVPVLREPHKMYALLCAAFAWKSQEDGMGSVPLVRELVARGADVYRRLNDTTMLIHFLFQWADGKVQNALLHEPCRSRIDLDRRDQRGRTLLMAACNWRGMWCSPSSKDETLLLLPPALSMQSLGADALAVDNDGRSALHHLLLNTATSEDVLIHFIKRCNIEPTLQLKDKAGFAPLHYALGWLRPRVCDALLSMGASGQEADPTGLTALHHIASQCLKTSRQGKLEKCFPSPQSKMSPDYFRHCHALWQRLVAEGSSINATDRRGNTPLHSYLLEVPALYTVIKTINPLEHFDELFPADDVDLFAVNNDGETMLHAIARRAKGGSNVKTYDAELFRAMMEKGLDPLREDERGRSALDVASAYEKEEIVGMFGRK